MSPKLAQRRRVVALLREKYSGAIGVRFGPTVATERLASEDGEVVSVDTVRRWMLAEGLWSRARKATPHRQRRVRKAHFGDLVQLNGSVHRWYEDRAPQECLMTQTACLPVGSNLILSTRFDGAGWRDSRVQ